MLDEFMKTRARAMRDFSSDDILSALGLERRHTALDAAIPTTLAFLAGAAAGAGLALLLAPKSGREVRADISNKATELTGRLTSAANEISNKATELTGRLTSTANEIAGEVRNALPSSQDSERRNAEARPLSGTNRTS
jgi:gas vesicle protein